MSKEDKDKPSFDPAPKEEWTLISQGAEARVWKIPASGNNSNSNNSNSNSNSNSQQSFAICKERFSKAYRHPDLDVRLTKSRCRSEAKLLGKCALKSGLRVPKVLRVSPPSLYLEYLDGPTVKSYLQQRQHQKQRRRRRQQQQQENDNDNDNDNAGKENSSNTNDDAGSATIPETVLARQMGRLVGKLHNIGIVHGDLTTSNMIVLRASKGDNDETEPELELELALIDLGLSKSTTSVEEQAVDLYVLERALLSTHPDLSDTFFDQVLEEYRINTELYQVEMDDDDGNGNGNGNGKSGNRKKRKFHNHTTLQRLEQVRMRGRKRECFG